MTRFLAAVALLSAAMLSTIYSGWFRVAHTTWPLVIVAFLAVGTTLVFAWLNPVKEKDPERFTRLYLGSIALKILLACALVIAFVSTDRQGAAFNVTFFICGYMLFTAVEVIFLLLRKRTS